MRKTIQATEPLSRRWLRESAVLLVWILSALFVPPWMVAPVTTEKTQEYPRLTPGERLAAFPVAWGIMAFLVTPFLLRWDRTHGTEVGLASMAALLLGAMLYVVELGRFIHHKNRVGNHNKGVASIHGSGVVYTIPRVGAHGRVSCSFGRHWWTVVRTEKERVFVAVKCGVCRKALRLHDIQHKEGLL